ncbi:MAG TPA: hypothetical protein VK051_02425 [Paenalcaligenes sp.]|nr:hypothetical protein [Paenalcaligenes sp.]
MKFSAKKLVALCLSALFVFAVAGCDADGPEGGGQAPAQGAPQ